MAAGSLKELPGLLDQVAGLAARKKALAEAIRDLTLEQSGLLVPDRAEGLLAVIEKKQGLMDEVDIIDAEMLKLEKRIKDAVEAVAGDDLRENFNVRRREVEKLKQEIALILQEIQRLHEKNRQKINEEYIKLKADIESLRAKRNSIKTYRGTAFQAGGYFIDKKK